MQLHFDNFVFLTHMHRSTKHLLELRVSDLKVLSLSKRNICVYEVKIENFVSLLTLNTNFLLYFNKFQLNLTHLSLDEKK